MDNALADDYILSLTLDHNTPSTLYVGTYGPVYKTTDSGTTWRQVGPTAWIGSVYSLAIDPTNPGILYAATDPYGVFSIQQIHYDHIVYLPLLNR
jgi:hypothetical protein